jgi:Ca-activated chloride channel family protein
MIFDLRNIHEFYFAWPWALLLLLLIPAGWLLHARRLEAGIRKTALHFSYTAVVAQLGKQPVLWKRLLPVVGAGLLSAILIIGLARPTIVARVPVSSVDMMLVLDISLSMLAEDIRPDRLSAARDAAVQFVESLPRDARVGLEVFAGTNYVLAPPTRNHGEVAAYLRALRKEDLKPRTEIGSALHTALRVLTQGTDAAALVQAKAQAQNQSEQTDTPPGSQNAASNPGGKSKNPDRVIILLSDGDSHEGYPWDRAAQDARQANVIVHTVGIGSPEGSTIVYQGLELPVNFDETTLKQIAETGGGSYFRVFTESDFRKVYEQIHERTVHYEEQAVDLAFLTAALGLLLLAGWWLLTAFAI